MILMNHYVEYIIYFKTNIHSFNNRKILTFYFIKINHYLRMILILQPTDKIREDLVLRIINISSSSTAVFATTTKLFWKFEIENVCAHLLPFKSVYFFFFFFEVGI